MPDEGPEGHERRSNFELRERLDELFDLAVELSRRREELTRDEIEDAQARFEWLAEEIWRAAVFGPLEQITRTDDLSTDPEAGAGDTPEPEDG